MIVAVARNIVSLIDPIFAQTLRVMKTVAVMGADDNAVAIVTLVNVDAVAKDVNAVVAVAMVTAA